MSGPRTRGFTLLEVLIALAIVAISIGALLGTITSSASNVIYLKDKTLAEWVALNRLTEMRIAQQMPDKGNRTGYTVMGGMKYQWETEVIELPVKGMFRIDVHARPTGEAVDDNRQLAQPDKQTEPESEPAGGDVEKLNWTSSVVGVVGVSQSSRHDAIATPYAGQMQSAAPNNGPGGAKTPNAPGTGAPGSPAPPPKPDPFEPPNI